MVTKVLLLLVFCCTVACDLCVAQAGEWTWVKGDTTNYASGSFGTQGIPSGNNNPPGFYEPAEWRDMQGMLWMYGGYHFGVYDDLWRYDVQTNEWTWMKGAGTGNVTPVYGTMGSFAAANTPGDQQWCAASWVDTSGNFWLFGGSDGGGDHYNLLWKYDPSLNEWAWMRGSTSANAFGSYGVKGVPSANNNPPSRWETSTAWADKENNLWLFGGMNPQHLNDLWKYNIATNEWTWMSGSNIADQFGIYGTQGVADPNNVPGARRSYTRWIDNSGNLWLFGGYGFVGSGFSGSLNDLWEYDMSSGEWTWMSGSNQVDDPGSISPPCELSSGYPSARLEARSCWKDLNGNFWLYGGYNYLSELNDLWIYVPDSNAWALVSTSTFSSGLYGTQGISTSFTHPPTKMGALGWTDLAGNLWLSSGGQVGVALERNDLWKYVIDPNCPFILYNSLGFEATDTSLCQKFCVSFFDQSNNNPASWEWIFPGGSPSTSTEQNPTNICYDVPGIYDVTLITSSVNGIDTLTLTNYITVNPTPPFPSITQAGYVLTSSPASSYQWQFNSIDIPGATNQSYTVLQTGLYTVIISDSNGCVNSKMQYVLISGVDAVNNDAHIFISPNPSNGIFTIELSGEAIASEVSIDVRNTLGQILFSSTLSLPAGASQSKKEIDLHYLSNGIYFVNLQTEKFSLQKKIVISH